MARKLMLPALAACALLAVTAPVASAGTDAKQWKKIAKVSGGVKGAQKAIKQLRNMDTGIKAAIGRNFDGLTALSAKVDAVISAATSALTQLEAGLKTAGAGLTALSDIAKATRYMSFQVYVNGTALPGCFFTTGNLPLDANSTTVTGQCIDSPTSGNLSGPVTVQAACRTLNYVANDTDTAPCGAARVASLVVMNLGAAGNTTNDGATYIYGPPSPVAPATATPLNTSDALHALTDGKDAPVTLIGPKSPLYNLDDKQFPLQFTATDNPVTVDLAGTVNAAGGATLSLIQVTLQAADLTARSGKFKTTS